MMYPRGPSAQNDQFWQPVSMADLGCFYTAGERGGAPAMLRGRGVAMAALLGQQIMAAWKDSAARLPPCPKPPQPGAPNDYSEP